jgi:hypothetical protein
MSFDHVGYYVPLSQIEAEVSFLTASLAHIGIKELMRPMPTVVGFGLEREPFFWVSADDGTQGNGEDGKEGREQVAMNLPHFALKAASKSGTSFIFHVYVPSRWSSSQHHRYL